MPNQKSDRAWTAGLVALAILARAGAVLTLQSHLVANSTYEHGEIAANLLAGRGFSVDFLGVDGPTSQQAPMYPFLLAAAYRIGGIGTPSALLILELGQAILGGVLVFGVMALAREVAPRRMLAARVAGLVTALHPTLIYAATHVQVALLAATLLIWTFACGYRLARTGSRMHALSTGLTLSALILTDPILGLTAVGVGWAVIARRGLAASLRTLAIVAMTAVAGVTPWMIRNDRVHGEIVFIKSTFGYAFWQGNCALSEGTDKVIRSSVEHALTRSGSGLADWNRTLWNARHEAGYIDDIALTPADYAHLREISEPERSRHLFRRALIDLRRDPGRYPTLCLRRLRYFVFFDDTNPKTRSAVYRISHLALTMAALAGWFLMGKTARRDMTPTLVVAVGITLFHALTIVSARFHIPIEPIMALWIGLGASALAVRPGED